MTNTEFKDKVILILGGTGSIGSAIGDVFERVGAVVYRQGKGGPHAADISISGDIEKLIEKIISDHGRIDILVNAISAPIAIARFEKKKWSDFEDHLNLQLKAAVISAQIIVPVMKKNGGGRIINILTTYVDGKIPGGLSDYVTAKYAMLGLTKSLAKELGKYNITVNAVSPGFIENNFTKMVPEKAKEIIIRETPVGRLAKEQDVVEAVLFLASEKSPFISGVNIQVAGGADL